MKLKRDYKKGTLISFKWYYHDYRDQYENPSRYIVLDGIVEDNTVLNEVIVYNGHENNWYAVPTENIIKEYEHETTNQEKGI